MKRARKKLSINTLILILGVPAICGLRTAALLKDYNEGSGYFDSKALINASAWVLFSLTVLIFAEAFINIKRRRLTPSFNGAASYLPAGLCAGGALFAAMELAVAAVKGGKELMSGVAGALTVVTAIAAILCAAGFAVFSIFTDRHSDERALATVIISAALLLMAGCIYFDGGMTLNAPNKVTNLMAYIFASLFFLYEARLSFGREKWNLYALFGGIAALLCAYSSIPAIIAFFARGYVISTGMGESLFALALFIFIAARVMLANRLTSDGPCELVAALSREAQERDERIEAADRNFEELLRVLKENEAAEVIEAELEDQISLSELLTSEPDEDDAPPSIWSDD